MIDINELRDRAATFGSDYLTDEEWVEVIDRLEAAENDALEQARLNGIGAERELALMAKLEAAEKERDSYKAACCKTNCATTESANGRWGGTMIDINELRAAVEAAGLNAISREEVLELLDRLEAAEKDITMKEEVVDSLAAVVKRLDAQCDAAERERDECNRRRLEAADHFAAQTALMKEKFDDLRAEIERMEKQVPICRAEDLKHAGSLLPTLGLNPKDKLYALPGAQPALSVPDGWLPVPEKHPTFDLVDLQLSDGSVLCGCVPQADGDYWWEGPSGEVFIDPRYANVTHWRLAAAPEAKPNAATDEPKADTTEPKAKP